MPAKVVDICDAVKDYLNAETFTQSFTATRRNVWYDDLDDTNSVQVVVVPQESDTEPETRSGLQRRYRVLVIVQKRMSDGVDLDTQDAMLLLAEEIETKLYGQSMAGFRFVTYGETSGSRLTIDTDAASRLQVFRTVMQVSYVGE